jgi:hypothetical protein
LSSVTVRASLTKARKQSPFKTFRFPTPPFARFADVANANLGKAKIKIDQIGDAFAINIPPFDDNDVPVTSHFLGDRINL